MFIFSWDSFQSLCKLWSYRDSERVLTTVFSPISVSTSKDSYILFLKFPSLQYGIEIALRIFEVAIVIVQYLDNFFAELFHFVVYVNYYQDIDVFDLHCVFFGKSRSKAGYPV